MAPSDPSHIQDEVLRHSLENPEAFWADQANHLHWHKKPSTILRRGEKTLPGGVSHPDWSWFPDGEISTCYNCVDRHVLEGRGDQVAVHWDSPVTNSKESFTYRRLLDNVETLAGAMREQGVRKGDVVMVYSKWFSECLSLFPHSPTPHCQSAVPSQSRRGHGMRLSWANMVDKCP